MKTTTRRRRGWGSVRKLASNRYQASYTGPDGKRHKAPQTYKAKEYAEGWLASERALIERGEWSPPELRKIKSGQAATPVGQWVLDYFEQDRSTGPNALKASTLQKHVQVIRNRVVSPTGAGEGDPELTWFAEVPLGKLTPEHVRKWWKAVNRIYPDTVPTNQKAYQRLHTALNDAVENGFIKTNPVDIPGASRGKPPKRKYLMEDWEVDALISAAEPRLRLLTCLIFAHGLRIGEALGLEQRHLKLIKTRGKVVGATVVVEQSASRITVNSRSVMVIGEPKTAASFREVPIMDAYLPVVVAHMASHAPKYSSRVETYRGPKDVMLLTSNSVGGILMDTSYRSYLAAMKKKARVSPEIHPHCGRYWFITRLAEEGATPKEIGQISGQQDSGTITGIYTQVRQARPPQLIKGLSESLSSNLKESTDPDSDHSSHEGE